MRMMSGETFLPQDLRTSGFELIIPLPPGPSLLPKHMCSSGHSHRGLEGHKMDSTKAARLAKLPPKASFLPQCLHSSLLMEVAPVCVTQTFVSTDLDGGWGSTSIRQPPGTNRAQVNLNSGWWLRNTPHNPKNSTQTQFAILRLVLICKELTSGRKEKKSPAFALFDAFSFEGSLWGQFKLKTTERRKRSGLMLHT